MVRAIPLGPALDREHWVLIRPVVAMANEENLVQAADHCKSLLSKLAQSRRRPIHTAVDDAHRYLSPGTAVVFAAFHKFARRP